MFPHVFCCGLLVAAPLFAAADPPAAKPDSRPAVTAAAPARTGLGGAASLRNENVYANQIDNDALKINYIRLGDNVTEVAQPLVEANYFATEHGRPPGELGVLRPGPAISDWHGELFESLQNSVFNARTFFQVGPVKPSRQNQYGARFSGKVPWFGALSGSFTQRKTRGMVNGNVLVPLATERAPTATDPAVRAMVQRILNGYPNELANRPDYDQRALNTNSPQTINELNGSLRLDRQVNERGRLALSHTISRQTIKAFQLVAGQNPDTEIHTQRARATYFYRLSGSTDASFGAAFTRGMSDLRSEPNAVGPRIRTGYQVEELGPDSQFPIHRALNTYRGGTLFSHRRGSHTLTWGGDFSRIQLNGEETKNSRGVLWFGNNWGRTAIENIRMGTPTLYEVMIGEMARGFRNWGANAFVADQWKVTGRLQIYYGLRYSLETTPGEVQHRNQLPYGCDCNNFSPRFSIAWRGSKDWVLRTSYTISYMGIPPVTYQQVRYNAPAVYVQVQAPNLINPLAGINLKDPNVRTSPTFISPDLVSPYVHQYNLSLEHRMPGNSMLRLGYIGSRNIKPLDGVIANRGVPVAGIPLTTATVDQRRADPRYYEVTYIVNSGNAYLDAAQVTWTAPYRHGLVYGAGYTFGKAIDTGSDYSGTGANNDLAKLRPQSQFNARVDRKSLSNFDSPHSLLVYSTWDVPLRGRVAGGWQLSGSWLAKMGTPLTLFVGSDGPGFGNVDGGNGDRPNILDPSILGMTIGNPDTATSILRRDRFAYITPGADRGNLGRNAFRKGGINNVNASVSRTFRFGGRGERSLVFRGEAINVANHAQFDEPQRNLSSPAFGKITNTLNDGRVFQLGLRLLL